MFFLINFIIIGLGLVLRGNCSPVKYDLQISNGTNVTKHIYPFVVNVRFNNSRICTGVLLNHEWVLTAAHCIDNNKLLSIHYGSLHLDQGVSTDTVKVIQNISHPNSSETKDADGFYTNVNDVVVLKLEHPLNYSKTLKPGRFPKADATLKEDNSTIGINVGWGNLDSNRTRPDFLQEVYLKIYNPEYCATRYTGSAFFDPKTMFCAGDDQDTKGHCNGDSGGPILVDGLIWGIVSFTQFPCIVAPGVYTNIVPFLGWIKNVTGIAEL